MTAKEIFSTEIEIDRRMYSFTINESEQGDTYLKIFKRKKTGYGFEEQYLTVFEQDINDFSKLLRKTLKRFKQLKGQQNASYSVEKIRETHKQAYLPWTKEADNMLELLFSEGKKTKELAEIFGRNNGAILSRINKLELKEKYNR